MAYVIADNIISPLGETSWENYLSVKAGKSMLHVFPSGSYGIQEGFCASLLPEREAMLPGECYFEQLVLASAQRAIDEACLDVTRHRIVLILSTTKGAIENLGLKADEENILGATAQSISTALGILVKPIVVCNACISGLSALILAQRLLDSDVYDYAVVCGADTPRRFVVSGFQSLKALSTIPCRPFDLERFGLNLGEAAATIILGRDTKKVDAWQIGRGFVKNDAFHISAPSKTSEGLYACLQETMRGISSEDIGFINAHGTATLFNDQMESVAIQRAGLSEIPTNALKGYFGHTLGAAGILETILCMKAADDHIIIGTRGFEELGVSGKVNMKAEQRTTDKHTFVKMLSGFGGCNATLLATRHPQLLQQASDTSVLPTKNATKKHHVVITPTKVEVDGKPLKISKSEETSSWITAIYKQRIGDYPKFYKMDGLSRLGFVASELLLQAEGQTEKEDSIAEPSKMEDRAVVLFNRSSSISSDKKYLASIADKDNYFPSPSIFVYTLPNIVTGEIAIRHGYHGETSFYVLEDKDEEQMRQILQTAWMDPETHSILTGWLDYEDESHFEAELYIVE